MKTDVDGSPVVTANSLVSAGAVIGLLVHLNGHSVASCITLVNIIYLLMKRRTYGQCCRHRSWARHSRCKQCPIPVGRWLSSYLGEEKLTYGGCDVGNRRVALRETDAERTLVNIVDPHLLERSMSGHVCERGCEEGGGEQHFDEGRRTSD